MVQRQVDWARDHGFTERLELLAAYGFTAGRPASSPSPWRAEHVGAADRLGGNPGGVRALAAAGGDLDADVGGHTMLHHAAWIGDVDLVRGATGVRGRIPTCATQSTARRRWAGPSTVSAESDGGDSAGT